MDHGQYLFLLALILKTCSAQFDSKAAAMTTKTRRLPGLDVCGVDVVSSGKKIINGKPAKLGQYPWMANLGYRMDAMPNVRFECAGSLITDQYVITAAHCVNYVLTRPYRLYSVRLGELDLNETVVDGASPRDYEIAKSVVHNEHSNLEKVNDIALVKLKQKVTFSAHVQPICLPPPEFSINNLVGHIPIIAGWGRSRKENIGKKDTRLLEAEVVIKETDQCRANVTTKIPNVIIDDRVICASSEFNDACQGDSGGPLMYFSRPPRSSETSKGNIYLLGIVSYGFKCAEPGYPGVYTRVSEHMTWIVETLEI